MVFLLFSYLEFAFDAPNLVICSRLNYRFQEWMLDTCVGAFVGFLNSEWNAGRQKKREHFTSIGNFSSVLIFLENVMVRFSYGCPGLSQLFSMPILLLLFLSSLRSGKPSDTVHLRCPKSIIIIKVDPAAHVAVIMCGSMNIMMMTSPCLSRVSRLIDVSDILFY